MVDLGLFLYQLLYQTVPHASGHSHIRNYGSKERYWRY